LSDDEISKLAEKLLIPYYQNPEFWIGCGLSLIGIIFSMMAFYQAKKARQAAIEAGKTVKIQTVTIELTEIAQRLDKLDFNLTFTEARDLLNEISRKLIRLTAPFQSSEDLSKACENLKIAMEEALNGVAPKDNSPENKPPPNSIYFATQEHFFIINAFVAEIIGLFEKRNIEGSENDK
jgi:hypothetical protein